MVNHFNLETLLAAERPRLVRLCARLSGAPEAADDLAQETLLVAWHNADRLQDMERRGPWLSAVARNVCLNWSRSHYRDQARQVEPKPGDAESSDFAETLPADCDLEIELERDELVTLLDRALEQLPAETRRVLIERLVRETPHAEIAAQMGLSAGAVAVRLHRGKLALKRVLATELRDEAAAYGLLGTEPDAWTETRIWCPQCGRQRLSGLFSKDAAGGVFKVRCPVCTEEPGSFLSGVDLSVPVFGRPLSAVNGFRPALKRLVRAVGAYFRRALPARSAPCLVCGSAVSIRIGPRAGAAPDDWDNYELLAICPACGWGSNSSLWALANALPEVERFSRAHPRTRKLPAHGLDAAGVPALVLRQQSVTSAATLDVVIARGTWEILGVHTGGD